MKILRPVIIGSFGPPTLACIRSWGEKGYNVGFICIADPIDPVPKSKFLSSVVILPREKKFTPEGFAVICSFLKEFDATGVMTIAEEVSCWLGDNRDRFPEGVAFWGNNSKDLQRIISKNNQIDFAQKVGLDVLPTYLLNQSDIQIDEIREQDYPLCLRPSDPQKIFPSFKVKYIRNREELKKFIATLDKFEDSIIAQPFLELPNLNVHMSRSSSGDFFGEQSFIVKRKFKGVSLCFQPYNADETLFEKCFLLADKLKAVGAFDIEFLYDQKKNMIYFVELNNRLGGATAKAFACGYDEPCYALQSFGIACGKPNKVSQVTAVSRQALVKCLFATFKNVLTPFDYPQESRLKRLTFIIVAFFSNNDDIFSFKDITGSISLFYTNLKSKLQ